MNSLNNKAGILFYRFGPFEVNVAKRLLLRQGEPVSLKPKVFETLLVLIEQHGQSLSKDELMQRLWPDTAVEENSLAQSIYSLRKALGERPDEHQFIVTIPGRGYRFVATVQMGSGQEVESAAIAPRSGTLIEGAFGRSQSEASAVPVLRSPEIGDTESVTPVPDDGQRPRENGRPALPVQKRTMPFFAAGLMALLLHALAVWLFYGNRGTYVAGALAVPLTADPGWEGTPSLSPDGNYVVYSAGAVEHQKDFNLYVKQIGGGGAPPLRLTSGQAVDGFPAWSPDNRSIAFARAKGDRLEILLIPPIGGPERKLAEVALDTTTGIFLCAPPLLSWHPDGGRLVVMDRASAEEPYALFVLSVDTGEKRRLTSPPRNAVGDGNPAVSPDGRTLAFVRVISAGQPQVYILPLTADCQPAGEARRLEMPKAWVVSPAWTSDGKDFVCSAGEHWGSNPRLWIAPVSGSAKPHPLELAGENGSQPSISRHGNRLVYANWRYDSDIWRVEIRGPDRNHALMKFIASTHTDESPAYSWDGSRIVFASNRSGFSEIWMSNADGSNQVQLTTLESFSNTPRWFPDGHHVAFDSTKNGNVDIYVVDVDSRITRRLTNDSGEDGMPSVSRDGKWIYFSSARTGRLEVWRMPSEGGEQSQVTFDGGNMPLEAQQELYYAKREAMSEIWRTPVSGGAQTRVLGPVDRFQFAPTAEGIYFIQIGRRVMGFSEGSVFSFFSFASGLTARICSVKHSANIGLSISPDGKYALMTMIDPDMCDLMLVNHLR